MSKKTQSAAKSAAPNKSKKKKAPNRSSILASTIPYTESESNANVSSGRQVEPAAVAAIRRRRVNQIDYHYVLSDIKRITIIGGAMLIALIVLSQVIR